MTVGVLGKKFAARGRGQGRGEDMATSNVGISNPSLSVSQQMIADTISVQREISQLTPGLA